MHLVNDQDDIAGLADLLDQALHAAFKLAAELGAGHQRRQVKEVDLLIPQLEGHLTRGDALGQTLGNGGLAHARLTDEAGIILLAAVQDLHHPLDLLLTADHRVQLALPGALGEVDAVVIQELPLFLGLAAAVVGGGIVLAGRLLGLGGGIAAAAAEQAVQEGEGGGLAALLVVLVAVLGLRQLLRAAEGLHHLVGDVVQILRCDTHALHHLVHLGQTQLGGALEAQALVDLLVFLVEAGDEHHRHVFLAS